MRLESLELARQLDKSYLIEDIKRSLEVANQNAHAAISKPVA